MTFKLISKISVFVLLGLMTFSSCTKEDSVTITETEEKAEEIKLSFKMTVNGTEIETDAVAAYCQNDSVEFIIVANKEANLSFPLETQNFEIGDFTYFTSISGEATNWSYGGQALGEDITGFPGLSILFSDAVINIASNDGQVVAGTSQGTLVSIDQQGNLIEFPYAMDFVAEIVQESDYCE